MMNDRPSTLRVISVDTIALISFLAPVVIWGLDLGMLIFQIDGIQKMIPLSIAITIFGAITLVWRYSHILSVIGNGKETPAVISNITFFRDRGTVQYIYTFQGQKYQSGNPIHKTKRTEALNVGDQVTLFVDPNKPKRAYIKELFF